jgi:ADP-heptose:LPS heptosyltransferase
LDAIGDYILFRNFIEEISKSAKFKGYHITLIGNIIWKPIAQKLDEEWVDRFIWINLKAFDKNLSYRKNALKEIEDTRYSVLFHPTYSRDHYVSEVIVKHINAKIKIASVGDLSNTSAWQKKIDDEKYNELIPLDTHTIFEFEKNKATTSQFISEECIVSSPSINTTLFTRKEFPVENYIIFFIGGSKLFKKWDVNNWISLAEKLLSQFPYSIVLSGAPEDNIDGEVIKDTFFDNDRVINLCGKSTIYTLLSLISQSVLMVSNETSAPHIAIALGIPVVVIANGSHFGRFTPYPDSYNCNYSVIFPKQLDRSIDLIDLGERYANESPLSINTIKTEDVFSIIQNQLY